MFRLVSVDNSFSALPYAVPGTKQVNLLKCYNMSLGRGLGEKKKNLMEYLPKKDILLAWKVERDGLGCYQLWVGEKVG